MVQNEEKKTLYYVDEYTQIDEVSYVDKGANKKPFSIMKSQKEGGDSMAKKDENIVTIQESEKGAVKPVKDVIGQDTKDYKSQVGENQYVSATDIDSEELARLEAELKAEEKSLEENQIENDTLQEMITEDETELISEEKTSSPDLDAEIRNQKIMLKRQELENLKLRNAQLVKENKELKDQVGKIKGFQRSFDEGKIEDDDNDIMNTLKNPETSFREAQNIVRDGLERLQYIE